MSGVLNILLLCDRREDGAATVCDHIDGLISESRHTIRALNTFGVLPRLVGLDRFDGLILHYSVMADPVRLLPNRTRAAIAAFDGPKAAFVQDEHRDVLSRIKLLNFLGVDILFTCVPQEEIDKVYPPAMLLNTTVTNVLTGCSSSQLAALRVPKFHERSIEVGYRARALPAWLGMLGQQKVEIGRRFAQDAARYGLICDISMAEHDRYYGSAWTNFLMNCKATLGTESGASVFDPDGSVERKVEAHLRRDPHATFEQLRTLYFANLDGRVNNAQVSPRIFEAAALRTLMILYPGRYSGVVEPWKHYVPLAKDHSNMDEVVDTLRNNERSEAIIARAYDDVALNSKFYPARLAETVDNAFDTAMGTRSRAMGYSETKWIWLTKDSWPIRMKRITRSLRDAAVRDAFKKLARVTSPVSAAKLKSRLKHLHRLIRATSKYDRA